MKQCFPQQAASPEWHSKLAQMIPCYGKALKKDAELVRQVREWTGRILNLPTGSPALQLQHEKA